ncbi:SSU ribosomal protein S9P [Dichomitus squalens LYAD-421 SS1]|uniref:SSU ribosomal protein S9P n=1 Tax=Dichomitus squalens (strain LYAD-421) TaxID=732165 RepID=UPI0004414ED3|nr:SSU ribosomal protein S9P [Dichomitus squalens LYAD-421 SS1]EJF65374.1 SSU ribosomal protein S9P [Dichomitus squalens LYAD-421 SS1]
MNIARHVAKSALRFRTYATTAYVPPASLSTLQRARVPPPKPKPESPTFYTGRATYYDQLLALESAAKHTRSALQELELLPLPRFAQENLPPLYGVWKNKLDLGELMSAKLTTSRYRRFIAQLNQLNEYRRLAEVAGHVELAERIQRVLGMFERDNKDAILARGKRKPVKFDEYGRSYTIGRRKESTARCWVIAAQSAEGESASSATPSEATEEVTTEVTASQTPDVPESSSPPAIAASIEGFESPAPPVKVSTTSILINNIPLSEYFPHVSDRERVVRPFRIAGLLGAYNVFAIVRGGGSTGQSGAVTLAIAKALAAHAPDVEPLLRKAKLLKRDPRMVERKKTGRAKARKAYTWVKR